MRTQLCLLITTAVLAVAVQASAEAIDFTLSNPAAGDTVSGVIYGLTEGATSAASSVVITGYTQSMTTYYTFPTPLEITKTTNNTFTTDAGGALTAADFAGSGVFDVNGSFVDLTLDVGLDEVSGGVFQDIIPVSGPIDQTGGDFGSASFTPAPISAAPEPSAWALMIAGVFGAGAALRFGGRRYDIAPA